MTGDMHQAHVDRLANAAQYPHCDASILHAPSGYPLIGGLVQEEAGEWALYIRRIGAAPWLAVPGSTTPADAAPTGTMRRVIPLTQAAWNALVSRRTTHAWSAYGQNPSHVSVGGVDLRIDESNALPARPDGAVSTPQRPRSVSSWLRLSDAEWPSAGRSCEPSELSLARTVVPVSRGSSWSLTTEQGDVEIATSRLLGWSVPAALDESLPSWLSATWSVLTAIAPELTIERWQRERARLESCEFCDRHPEWQAYRVGARINFTGHHDPDKAPCPSSHHRDDEGMAWPGNHPRPEPGGRPAWVRGEDEAPLRPESAPHLGAPWFGDPMERPVGGFGLSTLPPDADMSRVRPGDRTVPRREPWWRWLWRALCH